MQEQPDKFCVVCGRRMVWRKKWRRNWHRVNYCSEACRHSGLTDNDRKIEIAIMEMLMARGVGQTLCPSEVARKVAETSAPDAWRALMPAIRNAARRLVVKNKVDIVQGGRKVDPSTARGTIRIRKKS